MTREEKKQELIALFATGAMPIGELIDACFAFADAHPNWISVEDELPKEHGAYLVFNSVSNTQDISVYSNGEWWYNAFKCPSGFITHWMPLVQPPKKENK